MNTKNQTEEKCCENCNGLFIQPASLKLKARQERSNDRIKEPFCAMPDCLCHKPSEEIVCTRCGKTVGRYEGSTHTCKLAVPPVKAESKDHSVCCPFPDEAAKVPKDVMDIYDSRLTPPQEVHTESWEEEFDAEFMEYAKENQDTLIDPDTDGEKVKDFIRSTIAHSNQNMVDDLKEEIRRLEKRVSSRSFNQQLEDEQISYNQAIDEIISLLTTPTNG